MTKIKVQSELQEQKRDDADTNTQSPASYTSSIDVKLADEGFIGDNEVKPLNKVTRISAGISGSVEYRGQEYRGQRNIGVRTRLNKT